MLVNDQSTVERQPACLAMRNFSPKSQQTPTRDRVPYVVPELPGTDLQRVLSWCLQWAVTPSDRS